MDHMTNEELLSAAYEAKRRYLSGAYLTSESEAMKQAAKDAHAAVLARMVPDGWKAVPREPTPEMRAASHYGIAMADDALVCRDIVDAAPAHPGARP